MAILKIHPFCRETIWGGNRLKRDYALDFDGANLAEAWMLSCHKDGNCRIEDGPDAGSTLQEYIDKHGRSVLGTSCAAFRDFPILVKFIDAQQPLSIQVHPSDDYALLHENQYGKTEVWYILDAAKGAYLYYGCKKVLGKDEFEQRIRENTLTDVLNKVEVKAGETYFIAPGTIHAIGPGIVLAEIQQNSNVTYRVYDYGRTDSNGNQRELHIPQAIAVSSLCPPQAPQGQDGHMAKCRYFTCDVRDGAFEDDCTDASFVSLLVIDGGGMLENGGDSRAIKKGDSYFLPAGSGHFAVTGDCHIIKTILEA